MINNSEKGKDREGKIDLFLDNLTWWYSSKPMMDNTANAVNKLTNEIKEAAKSSDRLTSALNKITFWGVIVASVGAIIAIANFILELYKYLN